MRDLAERMLFDPSYVSHVEGLRHRPTGDFARRADDALGAAGALLRLWEEYDAARGSGRPERGAPPEPPGQPALVVEREEAVQYFDGDAYTVHVSRDLHNQTAQPIIRYFMRISVDEGAGPPMSIEDLRLTASCEGRAMALDVETDQDALKEVWLLFRNSSYRFPLQPGGRTTIEYSYRVPKEIWGDWFQRSIRVPTRFLVVRLVFPVDHAPAEVWGLETSPPVADGTLDIEDRFTPTERIYEWSATEPWMDARYRLEWHFGGGAGSGELALSARDERGEQAQIHVDEALHR
jgi:hypothetical protein